MKVRAHVFVSGRVQGVFFRISVVREAQKRRLGGWVRNLPNGRVEAVFDGEKAKVEEMINFCQKGPPLAVVTNTEIRWKKIIGCYPTFGMR